MGHGSLRCWALAACAITLALAPASASASPIGTKLTGAGESGDGSFGSSVAVSADGNTLMIGAPYDNPQSGASIPTGVGRVSVFVRSGGTWVQQASFTGSGATGDADFGSAVALSADGNVALIGGPSDNSGDGAAWVFTRSGSTWTQLGSKLTPSDAEGMPPMEAFGSSTALSADGGTALIGGDNECQDTGAAWVFTRSGSTYAQQGPMLKPISGCVQGPVVVGASVALSSDGNTALIGASGYSAGTGTNHGGIGFVYTRSGGTWTLQGNLDPTDDSSQADVGASVSLSADGNTALLGGPNDNGGNGAIWLFTRSGSTWTQDCAKITPSDESGAGKFGSGVALNSAGTAALIGGSADNGGAGAAWLFTRPTNAVGDLCEVALAQSGNKFTGTGETGAGAFGSSVAVAQDAPTILIGGPLDNPGAPIEPSNLPVGVGAAWVSSGSGGGGGLAPSCTVTPQGKKTNKKGALKLSVHCNQAATLTLSGTDTEKKSTGKKTFQIGTVHVSIAAGQTITITVTLPKKALKALKQHAKESVSFTLAASGAGGTSHSSASIAKLKLKKHK